MGSKLLPASGHPSLLHLLRRTVFLLARYPLTYDAKELCQYLCRAEVTVSYAKKDRFSHTHTPKQLSFSSQLPSTDLPEFTQPSLMLARTIAKPVFVESLVIETYGYGIIGVVIACIFELYSGSSQQQHTIYLFHAVFNRQQVP